MHYAVPRILYSAGLLERLYTDLCGNVGWPRFLGMLPASWRTGRVRKLLDRAPEGLPTDRIASFPIVGLRHAWRLSRAPQLSSAEATAHLQAGRELAARLPVNGLDSVRGVYGYNSASLDLFHAAKRRGWVTIYEQTIAPVNVEWDLLRQESAAWPKWETEQSCDDFYSQFAAVESQEWELADVILCGSPFVRNCIHSCKGPSDKTHVVPYGVNPPTNVSLKTPPVGRRLRVLTVGTVGLRKGAPYVHQAALRMRARAEFRWVGPIKLSPFGQSELSNAVALVGTVPRTEMAAHYQWADVLLLPSICEGSATVTYEALHYGLPMVVTPNTGAPLLEGSGSLTPIRDVDAITDRLNELLDNPHEYARAVSEANEISPTLTVEAYSRRLVSALPDEALTP